MATTENTQISRDDTGGVDLRSLDADCSSPSYEELRKALDELHIVCECSCEPIFTWYTTDTFAVEARRNAIDALMRCHRAQNAKLCREQGEKEA